MSQPKRRSRKSKLVPRSTEGGEPVIEEVIESEEEDEGPPIKIMNTMSLAAPQHKRSRPTGSIQFKVDIEVEEWIDDELFIEENFNKMQSELSQALDKQITEEADWTNEDYGKIWAEAASDDSDNDKPLNEYEKIIKNQVDPSILAGSLKDSAQTTKDADLKKNTFKDSKLRSGRSKDSVLRPGKATDNDTTPGKSKDNEPEQSKTNDFKPEKSKNNEIKQEKPKVNDYTSRSKSNDLEKTDDLRPDLTKQNGPKIRSYAGIKKSNDPVKVTYVTKSKTFSLLKSSYKNTETEKPVIVKTKSKEGRSLLKPIDPSQTRPTDPPPIEPTSSSPIKLVQTETVIDSISSPSSLSPSSSPPAYHPPKPIRQYQRTGLKSKISATIGANTSETSKPLTETLTGVITSVESLAGGKTSVETLRSERISSADETSKKSVYEKTFKWPNNRDDVDDASQKLTIDILYSDEPTSYHINLPDESNTAVPSTSLEDQKKKRKHPKKVPISEVREFVKNLESKSARRYIDVSNSKMVSLEQIIISEEAILSDSKLIADTSKEETDKILDIEVRNRMGNTRFFPIVMTREDALIEYGLRQWFEWLGNSSFRYSPLSYICYICCLGWWHLHPFRLHIKNHIMVTIGLEKKNQECSIIAYHRKPEKRVISVRGECWQCGKGYNQHLVNTYSCEGCSNAFYTCKALAEHTGICLNIWKEQMEKQKTKDIKAYKCKICPQIFFTEELLHNHQSRSHVPRSDYPMGVVPSQCTFCNQNFAHYSFHYCSKRVQKFRCRYCSRHFPSVPALNAHTTVIKSNVPCRVCKEVVTKECMMPRHLLAHNKNFVMVYKCLMCVGKNILLEDLTMVTRHAEFVHRADKFTKTMWCYMQVPLPVTLYDLDRAITRHALTPVHQKLKESFLRHLLEEPSQIIMNNRVGSRESSEERDLGEYIYGEINAKNSTDAQNIAETINVKKPLETDNIENENSKPNNVENPSESNNIQNPSESNDSPEQENSTIKIENVMENYFEEESPNIESELVPKIVDTNSIKIEIDETAEGTEINPSDLINMTDSEFLKIVKKEEPDDYEMDTTESLQVMDTSNSSDMETPKIGLENGFTDQLLAHLSTRDEEDEEIKDNIHVCLNCDFEGTKKQFKGHLKNCAGVIAKKVHDFLCTKCDKNFTCMKDYVKHLPKHGFERCKCIECDREFPNVSSWSIHMNMHVRRTFTTVKMMTNESKVFRCRFCKEFVERKSFFRHWENHLELPQEKKVVAAPVGAEVKGNLSPELISRIEEIFATTKSSEVPKNCIVCDRTFLRLNEKKRHLVEHLLDAASRCMLEHGGLVCHFCGMNLSKPDEFRQHMREHAGLTLYHCELCRKTFSDSSNFVKHKKVHDVHTFTCDVCGNKFLSKTSLAAHIAAHRPEPLHCALCPSKQFYSESAYNKHVRTRHDACLRGFRCPYCRTRFPSLRDKWDHLWSEHKVRSVIADCPICGKQFRKTSDVKTHLYNDHKIKTMLSYVPVEGETGSEQPS